MRFRPAWVYIDGIRDFADFFCQKTFEDPQVAARACVVVQETLENAVKYSTRNSTDTLELVISATNQEIEFSVTSPPDHEHLQALRAELSRLNDTEPEVAFIAALERAEQAPDASARLGLARMRYEGDVELSVEDTPDGRIKFCARGSL
jgi:hypothetical protein